jgi:hypothetical protein
MTIGRPAVLIVVLVVVAAAVVSDGADNDLRSLRARQRRQIDRSIKAPMQGTC